VTTEIARQIFKQIPMGCAYFNIVTNNSTKRSEYILEDANETFYQYLGLDLEMDIHTNRFQLPDSLSDNPNWRTFLTTLNQWNYNVPLITSIEHKTFQITSSKPDNTSLFLIMDDITSALPQTKHENKMNELLSRYSEVFFENTQDGLFLLEFDHGIFRYLKSNKAHEEMTGVSSLLLKGKTPVEVLGEKDGGFLEKSYQTCISSGKSMMYEETTYVKGLQKSWLVRLTPIKNEDKITYLFGSRIDITELKDLKKDKEKFRDDLYLEQVLLKVTLNSIGDGVVTTNMEGQITYLNQMAQNISGWNQEDAYLKPFEEIFDLRNAVNGKIVSNPIKKVLKTGKTIELADNTVLLNKQGDLIPIADSAASIRDDTGHGYGVVMVFRDVTQTKKQQQRILYLSYHDPLTEIYNRRFQEEKMVKLNKESMLPLTIIMGDVNGLKVINDVFGHKTGDRLLKEVAKIMQFTIKKKGIAARWGGDEFLILMPKTNVEEAQDMIQTLEKSFETNSLLPLQISVSLGFDVRQSMNEPMHQSLQKAEEQMYHKKLLAGQSYRNSIINTLLATLYEKSMETEEHALRLETYCIAIAEKMGLAPEEKNELSLLAMLHDIGKVGINMEILKKPGPLNEEEWKEMRRHPEIGYRIAQNTPELSTVAEYILSHHERWDGSGYPRGLKGTEIPLLCRILAIADSYDAMTNNRAYRKAMDCQIAMEEIKRCQGTQFDPQIVEIFLGLNQIY
jgi:diguanylate cyclase (GGDEF)-like protein/PAS domain S-box-containing protein